LRQKSNYIDGTGKKKLSRKANNPKKEKGGEDLKEEDTALYWPVKFSMGREKKKGMQKKIPKNKEGKKGG